MGVAQSMPAAKWRVDDEPDPHGDRYDCERAGLTLGKLTDDEAINSIDPCKIMRKRSYGWTASRPRASTRTP